MIDHVETVIREALGKRIGRVINQELFDEIKGEVVERTGFSADVTSPEFGVVICDVRVNDTLLSGRVDEGESVTIPPKAA